MTNYTKHHGSEIKHYYHCKQCLLNIPGGESPESYSRYSVGSTDEGIQVWCNRCDKEIVHYKNIGLRVAIDNTGCDMEGYAE